LFSIYLYFLRVHPIDCKSDILPFKRLGGFYESVDYVPEIAITGFQNCNDIPRVHYDICVHSCVICTQSVIINIINYKPNWPSISLKRQRYNGNGDNRTIIELHSRCLTYATWNVLLIVIVNDVIYKFLNQNTWKNIKRFIMWFS